MMFREAATLARDAEVGEMWLTHFSPSLIRPDEYMDMVRGIFPNAYPGKDGKTMELNLDNYRKKTACLIQNFVHFQMTLRENLAPNDFSELSEDPLIDFANNFPDRLNTFLGALDSNGVELSGGQWKRIALYRTLHKKDVDLIVLDEPTANLDPKISENIINRLLKPNYNKTVIVITHDFELAKKFDRIIGMKEGKIICDSPPQAFAWELFEKHNSDKRSLPQIG